MGEKKKMTAKEPYSVVISGTGLYTPENVITNEELVAAYNGWANRYNEENAEKIEKGEVEAKPPVISGIHCQGIRHQTAVCLYQGGNPGHRPDASPHSGAPPRRLFPTRRRYPFMPPGPP